jgi:phospholipid/cholesterol/gamma-HCH transport system substrate-binding protein
VVKGVGDMASEKGRDRLSVEFGVGLFVLAGIACFAWLSVKLGDVSLLKNDTYPVIARFTSISGLKEGAVIEIAGVRVGTVEQINLDRSDYEAVVNMAIKGDVQLQEDSIASIRTAGVIGDKYVNITPGGSDTLIKPGDKIRETESSISLEELVSKYIFQKDP